MRLIRLLKRFLSARRPAFWTPAFLTLAACFINTACFTIGTKERRTIVYASFAKTPLELEGVIRIATNRRIPVTVIGEDEIHTTMDLGGYCVVHPNDLRVFVQAFNRAARGKETP